MLQRAKEKARKAKEAATIGHGGVPSEGEPPSSFTHGGKSEKKKKQSAPKQQHIAAAPSLAAAPGRCPGPAFPTFGVTLDFLERFTAEKVRGKPSRYAIARQDCDASNNPGELSFKKGEILGIGDLSSYNDGWLIGYRRAGDWSDRLKFREDAVDRLPGLSTDEVCGDIIKPETTAYAWAPHVIEKSYARMVQTEGEDGVGRANVFASHAWTFVFEELIESLRFFERQQVAAGRPKSFFWLDIFVVDENAAHTYPSEWWQTSFTQAVGSIGHTALVLTPWSSPVPLRRAWCLWEIYSTLQTQAKLSVCMSDAENADFHRGLIESVESVVSSLCTIDAETAEAGSQKDLDMIFAAVRTLEGGFQTLNVTVMREMRAWILESVCRALAEVGLRFVAKPTQYKVCCFANELDDPETCEMFESGCNCHDGDDDAGDLRLSFGNWFMRGDDNGSMSICADHYEQLSRMQKRKFKAVTCVEDLGGEAEMFAVRETELVGDVVPGKEAHAASILCVGTKLRDELLADKDGGSAAHAWDDESGLRLALALRTKLYGLDDVRVAEPMFALSGCEIDEDEGYELLVKAFELQKRHLPENHIDTAKSLRSIAAHWHLEHEDAKTALPFALGAVRIFEKLDPETKLVETCTTQKVLAEILTDLRRILEAKEFLEKSFQMSLKWHGPRHVDTAANAANLALHIETFFPLELFSTVAMRRLDVKSVEVMAGMHNHQTADCRSNLAGTLLNCIALHGLRQAEQQAIAAGGGGTFAPGDVVKVLPGDPIMHRQLSQMHGGWTCELSETQLKKLIGTEGTVIKVDDDGDVHVTNPTAERVADIEKCCFHPCALMLVKKSEKSSPSSRLDLGEYSTEKWDMWAAWRASADQPLPKLATLVVGQEEGQQWCGTEAEAQSALEQEAEAMLLSALADLECDLEFMQGASDAASLLLEMYIKQGRKKEVKALRKRLAVIETWLSEEEESEESEESDDDDSSDDDGGGGASQPAEAKPPDAPTLQLLYSMSPGLQDAMKEDNNVHASREDLERAIEHIHILDTKRPASTWEEQVDRMATAEAFKKRLELTKKRDQAASLLAGGWNSLVEEGTPPSRNSTGKELELEPDLGGSQCQLLDFQGLAKSRPLEPSSPLAAELAGLRLGALSRRVVEAGATADELEAMQDADDPKAVLVQWLLEHSPELPDQQIPNKDVVDDAPATAGSHAASAVFIPEGTPPAAPARPAATAAATPELTIEPARRDLREDFAALSLAVQRASPPSHAFGRAKTTGVDQEEAAREFEEVLSALGLSEHSRALRADGVMDVEDLRGLTDAEADSLMPTMPAEVRNRWVAWRAIDTIDCGQS